MKKILIVLFGVLGFQGHVIAESWEERAAQMLNSTLSKSVIYGGATTLVFLDLLIMVGRCSIAGETLQRGFPRRYNGIKIAV